MLKLLMRKIVQDADSLEEGYTMKSRLLFFVMIFCALPGFAADSAVPLKLMGSIPLPGIEGRIDHFTIDLRHKTIFVAALGADTVIAVDLAHGKVLGSITGLKEPQGLLYVPDNGHLYIANGGDGSVRIYDAGTLKQIKSIELGHDADNMRYDPAAKTVWVGYGAGAMAALDLDGNKLEDIPVGEHPEAFELAHSSGMLFVNVPHRKQIAVVDRSAKQVIATFGTGSATSNFPMAFDETNGRIFVACRTPARLLVLDSTDGHIVADLDTAGDADDLFYDRARHRVYVLGGAGFVAIYSQSSPNEYAEIFRFPTAPGGRTGLLIPQLNELVVAIPAKADQAASVQIYQVQ